MAGNGNADLHGAPNDLNGAMNYEEQVPNFDHGEIVFVLPREDDERPYAYCFMVTRVYDMTNHPEMYDVISSIRHPGHPIRLVGVHPSDMILVPERKANAMQDQFPADARSPSNMLRHARRKG